MCQIADAYCHCWIPKVTHQQSLSLNVLYVDLTLIINVLLRQKHSLLEQRGTDSPIRSYKNWLRFNPL